jgi:hypothetical protein
VLGGNNFTYLPSSHVETPVGDGYPEARQKKMSLKFRRYFEVLGRGGGKGTYVNAQPNIEDLICAGMSSGPAKGNLGIIE